MTTLHELIHESASSQERALSGMGRPSLHGRAKRKRAARQARIAAGATMGAGALAVGGALAVPAIWPQNTIAIATLAPAGGSSLPLAADGSLLSAIPANDVVVDVYLDPMCPICSQFSTKYDAKLREIDGATVVYHPVSILDSASSDGSYSTRAASAIDEVAAGAPDRVGAFLNHLWANQPAEGSTLTDDQLVSLATAAGVPSDVSALFAQHRYANAVAKATRDATAAGLVGVPTIYIDGTVFNPTAGRAWDDLVPRIRADVADRQVMGLSQLSGPTNVPASVSATAPVSDAPSARHTP